MTSYSRVTKGLPVLFVGAGWFAVASHPMRVAIVAGSACQAFDGIADYSEILGRRLTSLGHRVLLVGVNNYVRPEDDFDGVRDGLPVLNLNWEIPWPERRQRLASRLADFSPEALSVQYYWRGFWLGRQHQGITDLLREAGADCRRQIMFHETWTEENTTKPLLNGPRAVVAATMIRRFHRSFAPHSTLTNTGAHARQLRWIGVRARVEENPANIAVVTPDPAADTVVWERIEAAAAAPMPRSETWVGVFFGRIPESWQAEEALPWLRRAWIASGKRQGILASVGNTGYFGLGWKRVAAAAGAVGLKAAELGIQDAPTVSRLLGLADLGIVATTSDGRLLGKSTIFAAYRDHGLPVFLLARKASLPGAPDGSVVVPGNGFEVSLSCARRRPPQPDRWARLAEVYRAELGLDSVPGS
jgi:hypothetical protein